MSTPLAEFLALHSSANDIRHHKTYHETWKHLETIWKPTIVTMCRSFYRTGFQMLIDWSLVISYQHLCMRASACVSFSRVSTLPMWSWVRKRNMEADPDRVRKKSMSQAMSQATVAMWERLEGPSWNDEPGSRIAWSPRLSQLQSFAHTRFARYLQSRSVEISRAGSQSSQSSQSLQSWWLSPLSPQNV